MWDLLTYNAKRVAAWMTSRGMSSVALLGAAGLGLTVSPVMALVIALPIGVAASSYMRISEEKYQIRRMRNAYVYEIAAAFGEEPQEVTLKDLERVAEGSPKLGIPPNRVLKEQLNKIHLKRNISLLSMVGSVSIATVAAAFGFFNTLADGVENALKSGLDQTTLDDMVTENTGFSPKTGILALGGVAGGISFALDHALSYGLENALGITRKTTYEHIQDLKKTLEHEGALTPQHVMGVIAAHNPDIQQHIERIYQLPYDALSTNAQEQVVGMMEPRFHVAELTEKINEGKVRVSEVAFAAEGRYSGVPERDPSLDKPFRHVFLERFRHLTAMAESPEQQPTVMPSVQTPIPSPQTSDTMMVPPAQQAGSSPATTRLNHVANYLQSHAHKAHPLSKAPQSFAERLSQKSPENGREL